MNNATRIIRALRKLNKLFWRYSHEDIAKALVDRGIDRGLVQFCGEFLVDIAECMPRDPLPECAVCGGESNAMMNRAGVVYCSHKCRQKAYRDRIRDAKTPRIGRPHVTQSKSVTGNALISEHPASRIGEPSP
jgi:hypothetical protein